MAQRPDFARTPHRAWTAWIVVLCFVWVSASAMAVPGRHLVTGPVVSMASSSSTDGAATLDKAGKGQRPALLRLGFGPDLAVLPADIVLHRQARAMRADPASLAAPIAAAQRGRPEARAPPLA